MTEPKKREPWEPKTPVTSEEAQEILSRFNASHFDNPTEHARYSIPANPERDDDLRLAAFIKQAAKAQEQLVEARRVALALDKVLRCCLMHGGPELVYWARDVMKGWCE